MNKTTKIFLFLWLLVLLLFIFPHSYTPKTIEIPAEQAFQSITDNKGTAVYITPYGKKYHNKKTCAGKNGFEVELEQIENFYDPCQKCVH